MRRAIYVVCLVLLTFSAFADDADDAIPQTTTNLVPITTSDELPTTPAKEIDEVTSHKKGSKLTLFSAFAQSFSSIIVSELGDKTFFIAAIMSMRYSRLAVLAGALLALLLMTIISTAFGSIVPILLPAHVTHIAITVLFFFFGVKLLYDAFNSEPGDHDEQAEVEQELNQVHSKLVKNSSKGGRKDAKIEYVSQGDGSSETVSLNVNGGDLESSDSAATQKKGSNATYGSSISKRLVFWQALTLTFLGEWGDRSQIATIALAVEGNALVVAVGSFLGHVICTSLAVVGGKFLAKKISEKTVSISGGILFLIFGVHNMLMG